MAWTIKLAFGIILTSLTGSLVLLVWHVIGGWLERLGYLNIQYSLLKLAVGFFLVPICYLVFTRFAHSFPEWDGGVLFLQTPVILWICNIFCILWFAGVGVFGAWYFLSLWMLHRRYRSRAVCKGPILEEFCAVCKELGISPRRVGLYWSLRIDVPEFTGTIHPRVMLPTDAKKVAGKERRIIFIHELMHYRQKDIWVKHLITMTLILHFFNPVAWWLHFSISRWSEHACDSRACELVGIEPYFDGIVQMMVDMGKVKECFIARQVEDKHELAERTMRMKKYGDSKKKSPAAAAAVCAILAACSSVSVYAASVGMIGQYENLYQATVVEVEEQMDVMELEEFEEAPGLSPSVEEEGELLEQIRSSAILAWTVSGHVLKKTPEFDAKSGGSINVMATAPANKYVNVGIIEPDGTKRYVREKGDILHKFSLDQTGKYRVFVENKNDGAVDVEGSYIVR